MTGKDEPPQHGDKLDPMNPLSNGDEVKSGIENFLKPGGGNPGWQLPNELKGKDATPTPAPQLTIVGRERERQPEQAYDPRQVKTRNRGVPHDKIYKKWSTHMNRGYVNPYQDLIERFNANEQDMANEAVSLLFEKYRSELETLGYDLSKLPVYPQHGERRPIYFKELEETGE